MKYLYWYIKSWFYYPKRFENIPIVGNKSNQITKLFFVSRRNYAKESAKTMYTLQKMGVLKIK